MLRLIKEYSQSGIDANKAIKKSEKKKQYFFNLVIFQEQRNLRRNSRLFVEKYNSLNEKKLNNTATEKEIALLKELEKEKRDYYLRDLDIENIKRYGR